MQCEICGEELKLIHKGTRDNPNIDVYECSTCHTKQLSLIIDNDYANGFMNGKIGMTVEDINNRLDECKIDDIRRTHMVEPWIVNRKVLDFGCGFGGFIDAISVSASSVSGVEQGSDERNYLLNRGFNVKDSIEAFDEDFDVITLFHVFEHLNDPDKWLKVIASKLKMGGTLFIEVPNSNDALLDLYQCSSFADFTYWSAHLYLYSIQSLTEVISRSGLFEIEDADQIQRYPLANHLYWLSKGKPGGQNVWSFLDQEDINEMYSQILSKKGLCDTLFFRMRRI